LYPNALTGPVDGDPSFYDNLSFYRRKCKLRNLSQKKDSIYTACLGTSHQLLHQRKEEAFPINEEGPLKPLTSQRRALSSAGRSMA